VDKDDRSTLGQAAVILVGTVLTALIVASAGGFAVGIAVRSYCAVAGC
jgi:hypothetical protein